MKQQLKEEIDSAISFLIGFVPLLLTGVIVAGAIFTSSLLLARGLFFLYALLF